MLRTSQGIGGVNQSEQSLWNPSTYLSSSGDARAALQAEEGRVSRGLTRKPRRAFWHSISTTMMNMQRRHLLIGIAAASVLLLFFLSRGGTGSLATLASPPSQDEYDKSRGVYRLAIVTDLDHASKDQGADGKTFWKSYFRRATLTRTSDGRYTCTLDDERDTTTLRTRLALDGRGMELSWLQSFDGKLYSGDDRSGIIYEIGGDHRAHARFVLPDGDGTEEKGFKSEWAAVKGNQMYVGSFGKEWSSDDGEYINGNPQWVKVIDRFGGVQHVDWAHHYDRLRAVSGYEFPSYLFHESAAWNERLKRWVFVPRRASKEKYNPDVDETKGTNLLFLADESFSKVEVRKIDIQLDADINPKGFSEIKFIPGHDEIVALRSMEYQGKTESWITVFDLDGKILMDDVRIGPYKFEGLEFI